MWHALPRFSLRVMPVLRLAPLSPGPCAHGKASSAGALVRAMNSATDSSVAILPAAPLGGHDAVGPR